MAATLTRSVFAIAALCVPVGCSAEDTGRQSQPALTNPGAGCPLCPLVARCQNVTVAADATCHANASIDAGSADFDLDAACTQDPPGPYPLGTTNVVLLCLDADVFVPPASCAAVVTVVDSTPPSIVCPTNQTLECFDESGVAPSARATDNCSVTVQCVPAVGTALREDSAPAIEVCTAFDASGNKASCTFGVTVVDTLPPTVTVRADANGFSATLWPPNHEYRTITVDDCIASIMDRCDGALPASAATILRVTSDEPVLGGGSGHTEPDIVIVDAHTVQVRAERDGTGDGRVYTIRMRVADDDGNMAAAACKIAVPHDQSGRPAVDSGPAYCVGTGC
jgi:hypothetical protein